MSNFLAIATATVTLAQILEDTAKLDVSGATVKTVRPNAPANQLPNPGVNIYLFQVTPNAAWRNADLPTRRAKGDLVQRPRVVVDLHYLMSFYGNDSQLEPQRLLGSAVRTLHAQPILSREKIRKVIDTALLADPHHYLKDSNLDKEIELVKFTPLPLTLEELSKLWSVFFQTPYTLSVAYQGTVVLIESDDTPQEALPVQTRNVRVIPFRQPIIERVVSQAGANEPILASSTLLILGQRLRGDITRVRIGGVELQPLEISDTQINLPLSALPAIARRAGVQGVQVVQEVVFNTQADPHRGFESNVAAFVLHPTITPVNASSTQVTLQVNPIVRKGQRLILLLNERSDTEPAAYTFATPPQPADSNSIQISISGVKPAKYFVRVQVDGAESPLDLDPDNPTFGPKVEIP